jgi:hypothetical protein
MPSFTNQSWQYHMSNWQDSLVQGGGVINGLAYVGLAELDQLLVQDALEMKASLAEGEYGGALVSAGLLVIKPLKFANLVEKEIAAEKRLQKSLDKVCCFVAGTLVLTAEGEKPIEEIKLGDLVYSQNTDTGEKALKPVTHLFEKYRPIYELVVVDENGNHRNIETTEDHPFYVKDRGWIQAHHLAVDDVIESEKKAVVKVVSGKQTDRITTTYNLEVADFHTYYATEFGLLVHNQCNPNTVYRTTKEAKEAAESLGYKKINETVHNGQAVFKKDNFYITRDVDGHNGGAWKMAKSVEDLGSKQTRLGTFDANLNRIGD